MGNDECIGAKKMTNFKRWLNSLKPEDFIDNIGKENSSFKLGCENCPIGKSACNRDPFFEPCDSKLLRWFKSKPKT